MLMPDDERPEPCIYTALVPETPRFLFSGFSSRARLSARMSLPQSIDATVSMLIRIHDSAMGSFVSHTARRGSTYCMYQAALTLSGLWLIEVRFITFMRLAHSRKKKDDTAAPLRKQIWGPVVLLTVANRKSGGMV
jgi:hypothetical protein